jgi:PEP-CTERM motif
VRRPLPTLIALAAAAAFVPGLAGASVFGSLGNFDVVNDTGSMARGFEIELEGLHFDDVTDTFGGPGRGFPPDVERYGAPSVSEYNEGGNFGVRVTYLASFAAGAWNVGTPSGVFTTPGESCWSGGGIDYGPSTPCDHFGVGTVGNPSKSTYSWLVEASPGSATLNRVVSSVPGVSWSATPQPGLPDAPPIVVAQIRAPAPVDSPEPQFGTPIWVKVYTSEYEGKVALEDLLGGNPKIGAAEVEMEWQLLQTDPGNPLSGVLENGGLAPVSDGTESVVRRYEFYKYTGAVKAEDNEAQPMFGDSHADPSEVGDFIGAQNAAINLGGNVPAVPEPATWASMGLGLAALAALRLRGRRERAHRQTPPH